MVLGPVLPRSFEPLNRNFLSPRLFCAVGTTFALYVARSAGAADLHAQVIAINGTKQHVKGINVILSPEALFQALPVLTH